MIFKLLSSRDQSKSNANQAAARRRKARRVLALLALIGGLEFTSSGFAQGLPTNPLRGQFVPDAPSWERPRMQEPGDLELNAPENGQRDASQPEPRLANRASNKTNRTSGNLNYPVARAAYQAAPGAPGGSSVLKKNSAPPAGRPSTSGGPAATGAAPGRSVPAPPEFPPNSSSGNSAAGRPRSNTTAPSAPRGPQPEYIDGPGRPIGSEWVVGQPVWTDEQGRVIDGGEPLGHEYREPVVSHRAVHHQGRAPLRGRLYASGEVLALWTKGMDVPILATSSPSTTPINEMGILGAAGTTILLGNQGLNNEGRGAGRVGLGMWLNPGCGTRVESNYLFANEMTTTFNVVSPATSVIARPFLNSTTGLQDANLLAIPNQLSGSFTSQATTNFNSVDVLYRTPLAGSCDTFVDFTAGYRHAGLDDSLRIDDSITALVGFPTNSPVLAAGTTVSSTDLFDTSNQFDGGQIGFACEMVRQRWTYELLLNLALGNTHSTATVNGTTTTRLANGTSSTANGGVLALPSNSGTFEANNFSTISELGLRMNYDFAARWRISVVYSLNYWSHVARAGNLVNTVIDPNQLPAGGGGSTGVLPEFQFNFTDFWAQGIGLRLEHQF